jgi:hypothetical protein
MNRRTITDKDRGANATGGSDLMTDTSTNADTSTNTTGTPASTTPPAGDRLARFERDLETIGHRTSRADRKWALAGAIGMAVGIAIAVAAYASSTSLSDTRDVISSGILAMVGVSIVIAGGAIFVRSSLTEFLRFWMLRLLYEQHSDRGDES